MRPDLTFIHKILQGYKTLAIIGFNTLVLIALFLASITFFSKPPKEISSQDRAFYLEGAAEPLEDVYPHMTREEVFEMLKETWERPFSYAPFVQFLEVPFKGKYVNVSSHRYRLVKNQGPWPLDKEATNIFVFGGSSTFGYGVADEETIPSHLQEILSSQMNRKVYVYNFGQGSYYSTQERLFFERLLMEGVRPDLAVFIDGFNEFSNYLDEPRFTILLEKIFSKTIHNEGHSLFGISRVLSALPQALRRTRDLLRVEDYLLGQEKFVRIIRRYMHNKRMIEVMAATYQVSKPVFVFQPVATHEYDAEFRTYKRPYERRRLTIKGYQVMDLLKGELKLGDNFLWLGDIQKNIRHPVYVDSSHYSNEMSRVVAEHIARRVKEMGLVSS